MVVGFTGTRSGMTAAQVTVLTQLFMSLGVTVLHHGDCVGADAEADALALESGIRRVAHPGLGKHGDTPNRAWCQADEIMQPLPYAQRNKAIVTVTDYLIAAPATAQERLFSGTWQTWRLARSLRKPYSLILPDGTEVSRN